MFLLLPYACLTTCEETRCDRDSERERENPLLCIIVWDCVPTNEGRIPQRFATVQFAVAAN